jgi:hypothetical protein
LGRQLTFLWKDLPLSDAVRVLARYISKPINIAVVRPIRVSGNFDNMPATDILRSIANSNNLQLAETPEAFTIQDEGRQLRLATAKVIFPQKDGPTSFTPLNGRPLIVAVPATKDPKAAQKHYESEHNAAVKLRQKNQE